MALDFPSGKPNGFVYTDPNTGTQWVYDSGTNCWTSLGLVNSQGGIKYVGSVDITVAPPGDVVSGDMFSVETTGTANAGYTGLAGESINSGSLLLFDGASWVRIDVSSYWTKVGDHLEPIDGGDDVEIGGGNIVLGNSGSITAAGFSVDEAGTAFFLDTVNVQADGNTPTRVNLSASTGEIFQASGSKDGTKMFRIQGGRGTANPEDVVVMTSGGSITAAGKIAVNRQQGSGAYVAVDIPDTDNTYGFFARTLNVATNRYAYGTGNAGSTGATGLWYAQGDFQIGTGLDGNSPDVKIDLKKDGSITAAGSITNDSFIRSDRFTTNVGLALNLGDTGYAFGAYVDSNNPVATIGLDGSATFASSIEIADGNNTTDSTTGGLYFGRTGYVTTVRPQNSTSTVFNSYSGSTQVISMTATGSAAFDGYISAADNAAGITSTGELYLTSRGTRYKLVVAGGLVTPEPFTREMELRERAEALRKPRTTDSVPED